MCYLQYSNGVIYFSDYFYFDRTYYFYEGDRFIKSSTGCSNSQTFYFYYVSDILHLIAFLYQRLLSRW